MQIHRIGSVFLTLLTCCAGTITAHGQTDLAVSAYEAFNTSTTGNGTVQKASNGPGGIIEFRQIFRPLIGYEVSYSLNPANQSVSTEKNACGLRCENPPESLSVKASEVNVNWIFSKSLGNLRPFALAGLGFYIASPANNPSYFDANTIVRPAYVYGGGIDWAFNDRVGIRIQARGTTYKAPNVEELYSPTGRFAMTFQPMAGVFFRL